MNRVRDLVRSHPLIAYFVLAYVLTWWVYPLVAISPYLGIFGLVGPAAAAIIVSAILGGRPAISALLRRLLIWQVSPLWYAVALGMPFVATIAITLIEQGVGPNSGVKLVEFSVFSAVLFILVIGEELGWRGFALPRLLESYSPLVASLILGVVWTFWHLPTFFFSNTPQASIPFVAYMIYVLALSVIFTWLYLRTGGSVLLATILHGAVDTLGFQSVSGAQNWWVVAGVYAALAVLLVVIGGVGAFIKSPAGEKELLPI